MNDREKIIQQIRTYFANTGVRRVSLFGSFARDEFDATSDVDLLIEIGEPIGYRIRIEHISEAITEIEAYVESIDEKEFMQNSLIRSATVRQFEIIG